VEYAFLVAAISTALPLYYELNLIKRTIVVRLKKYFIRYAETVRGYSYIQQYFIRYAEEIFTNIVVLQHVTLFNHKFVNNSLLSA